MARPAWQKINLQSVQASRRKAFFPLERGVYLDRPRIVVPESALVDSLNVRLERGTVTNENCGWQNFPFGEPSTLNLEARMVLLIGTHTSRLGARTTVLGTDRDLYRYTPATNDVQYLNPRYETGTVTIVGTAATFSTDIQAAGIKAGDYLHRSNAGQTGTPVSATPVTDWTRIATVTGPTTATLASAPGDVAGVAFTIRRTFTGGATGIWDVEMFPDAPGALDLLFGTNGVDDVWKWDGAASQVTLLTGLGFKCRTLTRASNIMVYGGLTESGVFKPSEVRTSDIATPENVTTGAAAEFNVGRGNAAILANRRLHENVIVYKGGDEIGSVHIMEFVGPPLQWVQRTVADNRGPRSMRAIAQFSDWHEFLSHDQAYRFDGASMTPLAPHVLRPVAQAFDSGRAEQAITHVSEEYGEVFWVYPAATDTIPSGLAEAVPSQAVVTHYVEEERLSRGRFVARETPTTQREVPYVTAIGAVYRETALRFSDLPQAFQISQFPFNDRFFSGVYPQVVFGDALGNLWIGNLGASKAGQPMTSRVRTSRFMGDGAAAMRTGIVKRVYPQLATNDSATHEVTVNLYGSDYAEAPATLRHSRGVSPRNDKTVGPSHTMPNAMARYFELELTTDGADESWRCSGIFCDIEVAGERG